MDATGEQQQQQKHVRPKVRNRLPQRSSAAPSAGDVDKLLEHTRQRIQSCLVVSSDECHRVKEPIVASQLMNTKLAPTVVSSGAPHPPAATKDNPQPKSILKTPKYSVKEQRIESESIDTSETVIIESKPVADKRTAAVKDVVMERDPIPQQLPSEHDPLSVEGYTPKSEATTSEHSYPKEPMVFSSISELMDKAGTLPPAGSTPRLVEADLSFACMTSEEYDETVECAESMDPTMLGDDNAADSDTKENVFLGQDSAFSDDDSDWSGEDEDSMFGGRSDGSEEEDVSLPEPRAFMKLWDAITGWATPETIALLQQWRSVDMDCSIEELAPQVDQTDVGSSRRKGLKAMLNMHLPVSMEDLGLVQENRRQVELRLDNFLRTLTYSNAMVKFDSKLWKAMTCVFIEMVLIDSSTVNEAHVTLPAAAKEVGMVVEEFRYLTRSAVTNLETKVS